MGEAKRRREAASGPAVLADLRAAEEERIKGRDRARDAQRAKVAARDAERRAKLGYPEGRFVAVLVCADCGIDPMMYGLRPRALINAPEHGPGVKRHARPDICAGLRGWVQKLAEDERARLAAKASEKPEE